jgi:glycosyltransferase involved in cell wall biosynthesis
MSTTIGISLYKKPIEYVRKCIESALEQTTDVQVILRTDGPDACDNVTLTFLKELDRCTSNFTFLEGKVNLGIYGSYREIFKNIETDNLCQLDADDYLHPDAIEVCERALESHQEYSMVYTDCMEVDSEGNELQLCERQATQFTPQNIVRYFMTYHLRVIRKRVYDAVGGYNESYKFGGDYDLCLKISEIGVEQNIGYIPIPLYYYRRDENCHSLTDGILDSNRDCFYAKMWHLRRTNQYDKISIIENKDYSELIFAPKISDEQFNSISVEKSQPVILTGMHRSFTSLTSNILTELGIYMGESILEPDDFNPEGYFENVDFLYFDRTLCKFCMYHENSFFDWGWSPDEKMNSDKIKEFEGYAKKLVHDRKRLRVWGWKDPRTSLLLNFWDSIIPHAKYIFVYRNPAEVYTSVTKLKGIELFQKHPEYIEKCWSDHNRNILEFASKNRDRCIVISTNNLTKNPNAIKPLLTDKLGLRIYDENLEHLVVSDHIRSKGDDVKLSDETLSIYEQLQQMNELF